MRVEDLAENGVIEVEEVEVTPVGCTCDEPCESHGKKKKVVFVGGEARAKRAPRDPAKSRRVRGHPNEEGMRRARQMRRRRIEDLKKNEKKRVPPAIELDFPMELAEWIGEHNVGALDPQVRQTMRTYWGTRYVTWYPLEDLVSDTNSDMAMSEEEE